MSFAEQGAQITGAFGGSGPKYRGYKPKKGTIRGYETRQKQDIEGLYGADPYGQQGLGYSQRSLATMYGLSEGARGAEKQRVHDIYATSPYGTKGTAYLKAQEGVERGQREDRMRLGERVGLEGERQARADLAFRMGGVSEAYGQSADLYNQNAAASYQANLEKFNRRKQRYEAVGRAAGAVADFYTGGMAG